MRDRQATSPQDTSNDAQESSSDQELQRTKQGQLFLSLSTVTYFHILIGLTTSLIHRDMVFPIFKCTTEKESHTNMGYSSFIDVEIEPEVRLCAFVNFQTH